MLKWALWGFVPQCAEYQEIKPRELFIRALRYGAAIRKVGERPDPVAEYLPVVVIDINGLYSDFLELDFPVYLLKFSLGFPPAAGKESNI